MKSDRPGNAGCIANAKGSQHRVLQIHLQELCILGIPKTVDAPIMSNNVMKFKVLPHLEKEPALFCTDRQPSFRPVESDPADLCRGFRMQEEDRSIRSCPRHTICT